MKVWSGGDTRHGGVPPEHLQASRRITVLPVSRKFAVTIPLRRSKRTNYCWPSNNWQRTTYLQTFITTLIDFPSCQSNSPQQCPRSTGNPRILGCLRTFSKGASKFTISWVKMIESTTSTLSWREMLYRHLKTLAAQPERF